MIAEQSVPWIGCNSCIPGTRWFGELVHVCHEGVVDFLGGFHCVISMENVQGVAPLPAGADSENRVEVVATQDHVNSGAGGGCPPPSCSPS